MAFPRKGFECETEIRGQECRRRFDGAEQRVRGVGRRTEEEALGMVEVVR